MSKFIEDLEYISNYVSELKDLKEEGYAIIYLSGPISIFNNDVWATKRFEKYQEKFETFIEKGGIFRNMDKTIGDEYNGFVVVSPPSINMSLKMVKDMDWFDFMAYDFMILNQCTHIIMLPMWELSSGAVMEREMAMKSGKIKFLEVDFDDHNIDFSIDSYESYQHVVNKLTAEILKNDLKYNIPCKCFYVGNNFNVLTMDKEVNHNQYLNLYSAPLITDVAKLLREDYGFDVEVYPVFNKDGKNHYLYRIYHNGELKTAPSLNCDYDSWEYAMDIAILRIIDEFITH